MQPITQEKIQACINAGYRNRASIARRLGISHQFLRNVCDALGCLHLIPTGQVDQHAIKRCIAAGARTLGTVAGRLNSREHPVTSAMIKECMEDNGLEFPERVVKRAAPKAEPSDLYTGDWPARINHEGREFPRITPEIVRCQQKRSERLARLMPAQCQSM